MTELSITAYETDWPGDEVERDLVERAKGDRDAFALLYRRHYAPIAAYVHRRVGDPHVADDLVTETFMAAMRSIRRFRQRGRPFRSWLYRIATNVVNRWARRQRRALWVLTKAGAQPESSAGGETGDGELARRALLALPPHQQAALSLHYLEGMPLEEVAAVCGCRLGTVKSRLARGRERLRAMLEQGR